MIVVTSNFASRTTTGISIGLAKGVPNGGLSTIKSRCALPQSASGQVRCTPTIHMLWYNMYTIIHRLKKIWALQEPKFWKRLNLIRRCSYPKDKGIGKLQGSTSHRRPWDRSNSKSQKGPGSTRGWHCIQQDRQNWNGKSLRLSRQLGEGLGSRI